MKLTVKVKSLIIAIILISGILGISAVFTNSEYNKSVQKLHNALLTQVVFADETEETEEEIKELTFADYCTLVRHYYTYEDVKLMANVIYGETCCVDDLTQKEAVGWCVMNRFDSGWASTISGVITQDGQFNGFLGYSFEPSDYYIKIANDVIAKYYIEKIYGIDFGRVLPKEYQYFMGNGILNYFTVDYHYGDIQYCYDNAYQF